jgi:hypothetical protein
MTVLEEQAREAQAIAARVKKEYGGLTVPGYHMEVAYRCRSQGLAPEAVATALGTKRAYADWLCHADQLLYSQWLGKRQGTTFWTRA